MKILQINTTYKNGGSTGRIAFDLKQVMEKNGIDSYAAYGINSGNVCENNTLLFQTVTELRISQIQSRLFAKHGFYNVSATKRLLAYIDQIHPDLIHLHNIHGYYVNCGMLFNYIKAHNLPVVWTLHDCWAFTGWCAYFDYSGCDKWKTHCHHCPSKNDYPKAWLTSRSSLNYDLKKETFSGVGSMMLVTPSRWLSMLTRDSFLQEYPVTVINNGVDVNLFKPVSDLFKEKHGLKEKKMILAVAGGLAKRKGSDYLLSIPQMLKPDEVLVILGIRENQKELLPKSNCIGISYTNSIEELVSIYSAADVFINTTLEDNFPTTNIEAMACGSPVVTFNTGGSIEPVIDKESYKHKTDNVIITEVGGVVNKGDVKALLDVARYFIERRKEYSSICVKKAREFYNKEIQYSEYIKLYHKLNQKRNLYVS